MFDRTWFQCPGGCNERCSFLPAEIIEDGTVIECRCGKKIRFSIESVPINTAKSPQLKVEVMEHAREVERKIRHDEIVRLARERLNKK